MAEDLNLLFRKYGTGVANLERVIDDCRVLVKELQASKTRIAELEERVKTLEQE